MEMGVISNINLFSENRSVALLAISALAGGALGGPHTPGQLGGPLRAPHTVKIFSLFLPTPVSSLICDIYHQNSMTEINSFDIYSWHKQLTYDTCQEIILPTTWKKSPSGWTTPEIILLNDLKTHQKWGLAFPMPLIVHCIDLFA